MAVGRSSPTRRQQRQNSRRDREPVHGFALPQRQRDAESLRLWHRERPDLVEHGPQQRREARERQLPLRLGAVGAQQPQTRGPGDGVLDQGALADAGLTSNH